MRYEVTVKTPCLRKFLLFLKCNHKSSRLMKLDSLRGNILKGNMYITVLLYYVYYYISMFLY